jgi:hypothetical protein
MPIHPMMQAIHAVAERIHERWQTTGFAQSALARIAAAALAETDTSALHDPDELVRWLLTAEVPASIPGENDDFASAALTVHRDERIRIEILLWSANLPATEHDHISPGAFKVLHGERLHYHYDWLDAEEAAPRILRGRLRHRGPEVLDRGDVREILTMDGLVHSLFFVNTRPTTLRVRSRSSDGTAFMYACPGLAVDTAAMDLTTSQRFKILHGVRQRDPVGFQGLVRAIAPTMELAHRMFLALESVDGAPSSDRAATAARELMAVPGELTERVVAAARWRWRRKPIERAIPPLADAAARFVLGLLWAPAPRDRAFTLLRERFPHRTPAASVRAVLDQQAERTGEALGLPWHEPVPRIVELLLEDTAPAAIPAALADEYDPEDIEEQRAEIAAICDAVRAHPVLSAWLAADATGAASASEAA